MKLLTAILILLTALCFGQPPMPTNAPMVKTQRAQFLPAQPGATTINVTLAFNPYSLVTSTEQLEGFEVEVCENFKAAGRHLFRGSNSVIVVRNVPLADVASFKVRAIIASPWSDVCTFATSNVQPFLRVGSNATLHWWGPSNTAWAVLAGGSLAALAMVASNIPGTNGMEFWRDTNGIQPMQFYEPVTN